MSHRQTESMYFELIEMQEETGSPCQDSPELFYPEDFTRDTEMNIMAERIAKSLCKSCPLMIQCRDYAIESKQFYGIWGGLSPRDRNG